LELVATCTSAEKASPFLASGVDLLFIDVQMPNLTGIQFLRSLENPPLVIITTAYDQYALEGFEVNAVDYLMKPVLFDRLLRAANKAKEIFLGRQVQNPEKRPFFFVRSSYKEVKIYCDEVLYIEGLKDYVKIFTASQPHAILTRQNLKAMEALLPPGIFVRLHNSFIVNISKISMFQKAHVFVGKTVIPIGEKFSMKFEEQFRAA
jgi:DNA-binding LytR/AlgR family response regulator